MNNQLIPVNIPGNIWFELTFKRKISITSIFASAEVGSGESQGKEKKFLDQWSMLRSCLSLDVYLVKTITFSHFLLFNNKVYCL